MYGQDLSGKSKMKQKVILAIFRQNRIKDHKNIKFDQEDYIYFQIGFTVKIRQCWIFIDILIASNTWNQDVRNIKKIW